MSSGNSVTCLCCIESRYTESGDMIIIVATWNKSVVAVSPSSAANLDINVRSFSSPHPQTCIYGHIVRMCLSPSQQYLACFTSEGWIVVMSSSFSSKVVKGED